MHFNSRLKDVKGGLSEWSPINAQNWDEARRIADVKFDGLSKKDYRVIILCKALNFDVVTYSLKKVGEHQWSELGTKAMGDLLRKA